jgi:hypothetical protein
MASKRRGGFRAPELRGTLGTLLRTTTDVVRDALERGASAGRDALERGASAGRSRLDDVRTHRRRTDALAELGEIVLDLIRRGEVDLAELPEARDLIRQIDELDAEAGTDDPELPRAITRRRFDDRAAEALRREPAGPGRPRRDSDQGTLPPGPRHRRDDDGTVSSGASRPRRDGDVADANRPRRDGEDAASRPPRDGAAAASRAPRDGEDAAGRAHRNEDASSPARRPRRDSDQGTVAAIPSRRRRDSDQGTVGTAPHGRDAYDDARPISPARDTYDPSRPTTAVDDVPGAAARFTRPTTPARPRHNETAATRAATKPIRGMAEGADHQGEEEADEAGPPAPRRSAFTLPHDPHRKGGISFDNDDDLSEYMHPDDVPPKAAAKDPDGSDA